MQSKNTLVLSWGEVRDFLFQQLRDHLPIDTINELELQPGANELILRWTAPDSKQQQVTADEQVISQPPCTLFNEACAPVLDLMGLTGIPIDWLEQFLFAMSFVVRSQERNGQVFMPEKFGHGVVGPYTDFAGFQQYVLTCLNDQWAVVDTGIRETHNCVSALALWVGANSLPLYAQFRDDFLSQIQALLEAPCE